MKLTPEQKIKLFEAGLHAMQIIKAPDRNKLIEQASEHGYACMNLGMSAQIECINKMSALKKEIASNQLQHDIDNFAAMIINIIND